MKIELNLVATNDLDIESLSNEDSMTDKYLSVEPSGHPSIESVTIDSLETYLLLMKFLFRSFDKNIILSETDTVSIFDLSVYKARAVSLEDLEESYQGWIEESKRKDNMNEYAMFLGLLGYVNRNKNKKYLVAVLFPSKE